MPVATSMAQLEKMLLDEMKKCMNDAANNILEVMRTETQGFYSQGSPKIYNRTGALGDSPKTSPVVAGGKEVSFDAYLDQSVSYEVPNWDFIEARYPSYFTTPEVFNAAEAGTAHILGKSGFWARSEAKMQQELDKAMKSSFE